MARVSTKLPHAVGWSPFAKARFQWSYSVPSSEPWGTRAESAPSGLAWWGVVQIALVWRKGSSPRDVSGLHRDVGVLPWLLLSLSRQMSQLLATFQFLWASYHWGHGKTPKLGLESLVSAHSTDFKIWMIWRLKICKYLITMQLNLQFLPKNHPKIFRSSDFLSTSHHLGAQPAISVTVPPLLHVSSRSWEEEATSTTQWYTKTDGIHSCFLVFQSGGSLQMNLGPKNDEIWPFYAMLSKKSWANIFKNMGVIRSTELPEIAALEAKIREQQHWFQPIWSWK